MQAYWAIPDKGMHESPAQETQERNGEEIEERLP